MTNTPKAIRKKYKIDKGDSVIYVNLGDHVGMLPVTKHPIKDIRSLQIEATESVEEMRAEALETAQRIVDRKLQK